MIITKDPENIKALLATQFNDFSLGRRYDFFKPLLGKGFSHWMVKDGNIVDHVKTTICVNKLLMLKH